MHAILAILVLAPATAVAAPALTIEGECPGPMTVTVSGLTRGGPYGLGHDAAIGLDVVGSGPCSGTSSALRDHKIAIGGFASPGGEVTFHPTVPEHLCDNHYLEFLDIATCEVSNAVLVGTPDVGDEAVYVGSYNVGDGPSWSDDVMPLSCLGGCAENFGGVEGDYQCSTSDTEIDNQGYYSGWGDPTYCTEPADESWVVGDHTDCGEMGCYYSAWVSDHCGASINHCWTLGDAAPIVADNPECSSYSTLDEWWRHVSFNDGNDGVEECDSELTGWHRFEGEAGTQMPESAPDIYSCGTDAPGWLSGSHPADVGATSTETVCYHWSDDTCSWSNDIQVTNCGPYYVYELAPTPASCLAYCGE